MKGRASVRGEGRRHHVNVIGALFLCSDQASFVTGQTILVDGGHTKKPF